MTRSSGESLRISGSRTVLSRMVGEMELPKCMSCNEGRLVPLSDYGTDGASVLYKAWACINPTCGFQLRIDKGQVTYGKKLETNR
jgi:hypothetical protein